MAGHPLSLSPRESVLPPRYREWIFCRPQQALQHHPTQLKLTMTKKLVIQTKNPSQSLACRNQQTVQSLWSATSFPSPLKKIPQHSETAKRTKLAKPKRNDRLKMPQMNESKDIAGKFLNQKSESSVFKTVKSACQLDKHERFHLNETKNLVHPCFRVSGVPHTTQPSMQVTGRTFQLSWNNV